MREQGDALLQAQVDHVVLAPTLVSLERASLQNPGGQNLQRGAMKPVGLQIALLEKNWTQGSHADPVVVAAADVGVPDSYHSAEEMLPSTVNEVPEPRAGSLLSSIAEQLFGVGSSLSPVSDEDAEQTDTSIILPEQSEVTNTVANIIPETANPIAEIQVIVSGDKPCELTEAVITPTADLLPEEQVGPAKLREDITTPPMLDFPEAATIAELPVCLVTDEPAELTELIAIPTLDLPNTASLTETNRQTELTEDTMICTLVYEDLAEAHLIANMLDSSTTSRTPEMKRSCSMSKLIDESICMEDAPSEDLNCPAVIEPLLPRSKGPPPYADCKLDEQETDDASTRPPKRASVMGPTRHFSINSTLDFGMSSSDFHGSGGGVGVYRAPYRGVVHPGRPVSLELRPHPFRNTHVERPTYAILCTQNSVWAACEPGLMVLFGCNSPSSTGISISLWFSAKCFPFVEEHKELTLIGWHFISHK